MKGNQLNSTTHTAPQFLYKLTLFIDFFNFLTCYLAGQRKRQAATSKSKAWSLGGGFKAAHQTLGSSKVRKFFTVCLIAENLIISLLLFLLLLV